MKLKVWTQNKLKIMHNSLRLRISGASSRGKGKGKNETHSGAGGQAGLTVLGEGVRAVGGVGKVY